jgi:ABC-2 type transport system permease protein
VNWRHLQAFVWLRWRLLYNECRRAGAFNAVVMMIVAVGALVTAIPLFFVSFLVGWFAIPKAAPVHLLYAWDALILGFLFFWALGLLTELQRTEPISLAKFLHLPVSAGGAFLINYLSSLVRLGSPLCLCRGCPHFAAAVERPPACERAAAKREPGAPAGGAQSS